MAPWIHILTASTNRKEHFIVISSLESLGGEKQFGQLE